MESQASNDPNIGREWNSFYGRQKIIERLVFPIGDLYEVQTIGTNAIRRYKVDRIEDEIEKDEYQSTPEYAAEYAARVAKREEEDRLAEEREAQAKAYHDDLDGFEATMNPMQRGKALAALNKAFLFDGKAMMRKEKIRELIAAGETTDSMEVDAIKPWTNSQWNRATGEQQRAHERKVAEAGKKTLYFVGNYDLGKIGYDYANFLLGKTTERATAASKG